VIKFNWETKHLSRDEKKILGKSQRSYSNLRKKNFPIKKKLKIVLIKEDLS
jgi:hypothetical protein